MADNSKGREPTSEIAWLVVIGLVALAVVAVPLTIGLATWYLLRFRLRRIDFTVILVASILALALTWEATTSTYFHWLGVLVTGNGNRLSVPIVAIWIFALFVASAWGLVATTRFASVVPNRILNIPTGGPGDSLIPTDREKQRISIVAPPPADLHVAADLRSIHKPTSHGDRPFPIGVDRRGKPVCLTEKEIGTHVALLGATGSGKTETIKTIAASLSDLDWNVVVLDLKEDLQEGGLRDFCRQYASSHAIPYQELALSDPSPRYWFNPLEGMTPDEASNAVVSVQEWDDGHWKALCQTLIGQAITLFYDAHRIDPGKFAAPDMYSIGCLLGDDGGLNNASKSRRAIVKAAGIGRDDGDFASLATPSDDSQKASAGLGARITNMYFSDAGRRVLRAGPGRQSMDVTDTGMCYIGCNSLGMAELARVVSTSVLMRLAAHAGQVTTGAKAEPKPTAVIIDEANAIDLDVADNLLRRARSAGIALFLCTQGPLDWKTAKVDFWPKITNNVNVGIIMSQGNEESAVLSADYIGTSTSQTLLSQVREGEVTESGTMQEKDTHIVSPQQLRGLRTGEAIIRVARPDQRVEWAKIAMRDPAYRPPR